MWFDDVYVMGVGVHLPATIDVSEAIREGAYDEETAQASGQLSVSVAPGDLPAENMAVWAAQDAIAQARGGGADAAAPGLLVHAIVRDAGCDGWSAAPYIQRRLGIADCFPVEVRTGCNGIAPMLAACMWMRGGGYETALVTAADTWQPPRVDRWRGPSGFVHADGASALLLGRSGGVARVLSAHVAGDPSLEGLTRGAHDLTGPRPATLDLRARAKEFFDVVPYDEVWKRKEAGFVTTVERALADANMHMRDVEHVVTTHLDRDLLEREILQPLGILVERTTWEYGRHVGHLGAGDQFAGLHHLIDMDAVEAGDRVLMVGVGAGYSWGAAVLEVCGAPGADTAA